MRFHCFKYVNNMAVWKRLHLVEVTNRSIKYSQIG